MYSALRQRLRSPSFLATCTISVVFLTLLIASWQRWLSPLTDSGRELDLPYRLMQGELLYRDINYLYGPLSPYFNAVLYWLFGASLAVLQASGVAGSLIVVWLSFLVARRIMDLPEAVLAVLAIVAWLVFRPQGNLISPYSYAALHATVLALASLISTLRYYESRRSLDLVLASALCGLAALCKLEFAVPALAAVLVSTFLTRRSGQFALRLLLAIVPFAVIAGAVYGWFLYRVGWETMVVDCHVFYTHLPPSLISYNAWRAGTNRPLASILEMGGGLAVFVAIASIILALTALVTAISERSASGSAARSFIKCLGVLIVAGSVVLVVLRITSSIDGGGWDGSPLRASPILLLAVAVYAWTPAREPHHRAAILIITTYGLIMLLRVALRVPSGGPYGAFLLPTTYIMLVFLLARVIPEWSSRWTAFNHTKRVARVILVLGLIAHSAVTVTRYQKHYRYRVSAPRGSFYVVEHHNPAIQEALDFLRDHSLPSDRIAVFPEGSDIAFLSKRTMPLRNQILLPGLVTEIEEQRMVRQLEVEPIRFVFVVNRSTSEFGADVFGRDFCRILGAAIQRDYHPVMVFGKRRDPYIEIGDRDFFIRVFERNQR